MTNKKLVMWGASGWALAVADTIRLQNKYKIVGYLDDISPERKGEPFGGSVILGGKEELPLIKKKGIKNIVLAFGDCGSRLKLSAIITELGFSFVTVIHPNAIIARNVQVGRGSVIAAGAIIDTDVKIGENSIVNKGAIVGHGSIIGDGVNVGPGVNIAGITEIGAGTLIGIGATIIDRIKVGRNTIVGANSLVTKNIPDNVVAYGLPAKIIRDIKEDK